MSTNNIQPSSSGATVEWFDGQLWSTLIAIDGNGVMSGMVAKVVRTRNGWDLYDYSKGRERLVETGLPDLDMAKRMYQQVIGGGDQ